jgi:superfamily II DNA or RNA helicase
MTALRPYQSAGLERIRAVIAAGKRRILVASPTGSGKTVLATEGIIRPTVANGHRVLFVAHRIELIEQCAAKLDGLDVGIIKAGHFPRPHAPVQVASVQTLARREIPPATVVVWDECHHCVAETYRRISAAYPKAIQVGLTATPYRTSGHGLHDCFDALVEICNTPELINLGFLVPVRTFAPPAPDLESVHTVAGDYNQSELAVAVDKPRLVGDVVATYQKRAAGRKAIVFAVNVEHSQHLAAAFTAAGVACSHLDGETPADKRREILYSLGHGSLSVVCNVGVLTEGTDIPAVSCIILARPTKSRGLWKQMVGRGLRTAEGKTDCILLDHAGCYHRHGLITDCEELTLAGVRAVATKAQPVRQCLACYAVVPAGCQACDQCGAVFPVKAAKPLEAVAGELEEAMGTRRRTVFLSGPESRELTRLIEYAVTWSYKAGWVGYSFKNMFHRWPCGMKEIETLMASEREKRAVKV